MTIGKHLYILMFLVLVAFTSCDKLVGDNIDAITNDDENCDCFLAEEPEQYDVVVKVTLNEQNTQVPITVFYGNVERNNVAAKITTEQPFGTVTLKLNHDYTYMAKYLKGSDTIYVPVKARLSSSQYVCHEDTCWTINNNVINLKLK
ncbi:MAG: hypothetical protein J5826_05690 [Bacteroidales bacterium]|nr:hypothetical protein [Bacteroidales bacterium]